MSDSARQPPDRLHLSSHAQLPLQNPPIRNVFHEHFEISSLTVVMSDPPAAASHRDRRAVLPFPFRFRFFEILGAIEQIHQRAKFRWKSKNIKLQISFQKLSGVLVTQHLL